MRLQTAIALGAFMYLAILSSAGAGDNDGHPFAAPGTQRDDFVASAICSCVQGAGDSSIKAFSWPVVSRYCQCAAAREADLITASEFAFMMLNHKGSDAWNAFVSREILPQCLKTAGHQPPPFDPSKPYLVVPPQH